MGANAATSALDIVRMENGQIVEHDAAQPSSNPQHATD